jgi:hypothetical protein
MRTLLRPDDKDNVIPTTPTLQTSTLQTSMASLDTSALPRITQMQYPAYQGNTTSWSNRVAVAVRTNVLPIYIRIRRQYHRDLPWAPSNLAGESDALYLLYAKGNGEDDDDPALPSATVEGNGARKGKLGTGHNARCRVKDQISQLDKIDQSRAWAACIMDTKQMTDFVPRDLLDQIKALKLPGLVCDQDHQGADGSLETLLRMQLCEVFFSCVYECLHGPVGERLVQMPSPSQR